jgi:6-phosphogluconolactonase
LAAFGAAGLGLVVPAIGSAAGPERYWLYVGNYTGPKNKGIQAFSYGTSAASLDSLGMVGEMPQPSFLALHPSGHFLYAVSELGNNGKEDGGVYAWAIDRDTGKLNFLNKQSSGGGGACHLVVDKTGKCLMVANYGTGSATAFPVGERGHIGAMGGKIQFSGSGPNPRRQKGPHAHAVVLSADNRFLFVPDLGTDQIHILRVDVEKAGLEENNPASAAVKPGSGPRHFTFSPNGKQAYVVSEMGSMVTVFDYEPQRGALTKSQEISTLPEDFGGVSNAAEIEIDSAGKFVYASNRGNDSIAVFGVDHSGKLRLIEVVPTGGKTPRNFAIAPGGHWLIAANQDSDTLVVFARDTGNGRLKAAGKVVETPSPVCLVFQA